MELSELKAKVRAIQSRLADRPFVLLHTFEREGRPLRLALTARLRKTAKRIWASSRFLSALKNAEYGFDEQRARSRGGADGIFLLDRTFRPANEMMRKLFDRYLDKPDSGAAEVAAELGVGVDQLQAVRLVSHHLRLLGVLMRGETEDWLVLVDHDATR